MTNEQIKSLTPEQISQHPAIQRFGNALRRKDLTKHKGGCNFRIDYPDSCDCGTTSVTRAAKEVGISL